MSYIYFKFLHHFFPPKFTVMNKLKRVIVDFKKLTPEVLKRIVECYPDGYGDRDIISFRNAKGERIEAVEVLTEDTKYLVKIGAKLAYTMEHYDESDYDDYDADDPTAIAVPKPEDLAEDNHDI